MEINNIYCGDNLILIKELENNCIDLTITSPPYDNLRGYDNYSWDFENLAKELYRVIKFGGILVWVIGDSTIKGSETGNSFRQALYFKDICGFNLHDTMIYEKSGCRYPEINRYYPIFEFMFVFSKGKPKTFNLIKDRKNIYEGSKVARKNSIRTFDGKLIENSAFKNEKNRKIKEYGIRYNIWRYSIGGGNHTRDKFAMQHPATFPEKLVNDHIISWSNPGDLILDPFAGSGTTLKMAKLNNRNYIGFEISEKYCNIIKERLKNAI